MRAFSRRLIIAVVGSALAVGAGMPAVGPARAAQAPASPGWRLAKMFGTCNSFGALSVTATGTGNAWATGEFSLFFPKSGTCRPVELLIAHWDGRLWQDMRPPVGFRPAANSESVGHAVAALSASYAWVFVDREYPPPLVTQSFALLWQNGRWRAFRLANDSTISSAVTFTHSNAWAFGYVQLIPNRAQYAGYALRFNGQGWRAVPLPVLPQGTSSPAPDNIWAVGPLASTVNQPFPQPYALAHWTGRWHTIPFPDLGLPSGEGVDHAWVVADGAHGAWVAGDLVRNQPFQDVGGVLLHWTGSGWVDVKLPFQTLGLGPLSPDGHGGLWITSCVPAGCTSLDMVHYSAGRLSATRVAVPADGADVAAMRLIPHTRSVWASGSLISGENPDFFSMMLKYGP